MDIVIDASVAILWFVSGEHEAAAQRLVQSPGDLMAPDLLGAEAANTLAKYVGVGQIPREEARLALREILALMTRIVPMRDLHDEALRLALDLQHPVYDCYYLALARRDNGIFVTADKRFLRKLAGTGHERSAIHLSDWRPGEPAA
jgi:predicted nucleic acid-binding protein